MHYLQKEIGKESQNKIVLYHLIKYGTLTSIQAFRLYQITRLSGRIYDLRKAGNEIESIMEFDHFNKSIHWVTYILKNWK